MGQELFEVRQRRSEFEPRSGDLTGNNVSSETGIVSGVRSFGIVLVLHLPLCFQRPSCALPGEAPVVCMAIQEVEQGVQPGVYPSVEMPPSEWISEFSLGYPFQSD